MGTTNTEPFDKRTDVGRNPPPNVLLPTILARPLSCNAAAKTSSSKNNKSAEITQMRVLAHDLSNALEAILQASYLLGQSKLNEDPRRWAQLIDSSSQEAARLNREIRKLLRALSDE